MSLALQNSIFFSLFQKNQKLDKNKFKGFSIIRGVYIDRVLKNKVFIASFGFNKDLFYSKTSVNSTRNNKKRTFVSYLKITAFSFINSFFYMNLYKKKQIRNYFSKKRLMSSILHKKSIDRSFFLLSNNIKKKIYCKQLRYNTINQWYNLKNKITNNLYIKKIIVKLTYNRIYSLNTFGIVTSTVKDLYPRLIFTGLVYMLPIGIKKAFSRVFILFNKLIKYYTRISNLLTLNRNTYFNSFKYFLYFDFLLFKIKKYFKTKKLRVRRSNKFLRQLLKKKIIFKIKRTLELFFFYNYRRAKYNIIHLNWINLLVFNKNLLVFNNLLKNKIIYPGYIKSINIDDQIKIIKFFVLFLNICKYDDNLVNYYEHNYEAYFNIKNSFFFFFFIS